jgi:hypothetical protein
MSVLRLLSALAALTLVVVQPRVADATPVDCFWQEKIEVFSCDGDPGLRDQYCQSIAPPGEENGAEGCDICADQCQTQGETRWYWCRATHDLCSGNG